MVRSVEAVSAMLGLYTSPAIPLPAPASYVPTTNTPAANATISLLPQEVLCRLWCLPQDQGMYCSATQQGQHLH